MNFRYSYILYAIVFFTSCKTTFSPATVKHNSYVVNAQVPTDSSLYYLMQPYRDSVNSNMSEVVTVTTQSLTKKQPEGSLGNFIADAMLHMGKLAFNMPVDAAITNSGGLRIDEIAAGPVTKGRIYELLPFDNILTLQQLKGSTLKEFLNLAAENGGWPVAGITMVIKDKKATNITINGQPLADDKMYNIILNDYLANGGDNATMLKEIPQINTGYLLRNVLFDYIKKLKLEGKTISANIEQRVRYDQ